MRGFILAGLVILNLSVVAVAASHDCSTWESYNKRCDCCKEHEDKCEDKCEARVGSDGAVTRVCRKECTEVCKVPGTGSRSYDKCSHGYIRYDTGCVSCS